MFTGIVQQIGRVKSFDGHRLAINADFAGAGLEIGDSIAINGCCQTVEQFTVSEAVFHVLDESRNVTNFKFFRAGDAVNVELALRMGDRLGGHILSGHIDCTGEILKIEKIGDDIQLTVKRPDDHLAFPLIHRGSVAINGVSLTVARLENDYFAVRLIPHTWENTNLQYCKPGDRVNLEADIFGKYAAELLLPHARKENITLDMLKNAGF